MIEVDVYKDYDGDVCIECYAAPRRVLTLCLSWQNKELYYAGLFGHKCFRGRVALIPRRKRLKDKT